jgi:hypothetical protein
VPGPTLAQKRDGIVHVVGPCAPVGIDDDAPTTGCCIGEVMGGPSHCTCWEPVYDLEQQPLADDGVPPDDVPIRAKCCHDCAYRNGSPERADPHEEDALLALPHQEGREFWCHQGLRRAVAYRHPDGRTRPAGDGDYQPPIGPAARPVAWKADGTVGELCAGWAAHRGVMR